jgi:hypothetical protein
VSASQAQANIFSYKLLIMIYYLILALAIDLIQNIIKYRTNIELMKWKKFSEFNSEEKLLWCFAFMNIVIWLPFILYISIKHPSYLTIWILITQLIIMFIKPNKYVSLIIDAMYFFWLLYFWILYFS